jgi:hypothetical protein
MAASLLAGGSLRPIRIETSRFGGAAQQRCAGIEIARCLRVLRGQALQLAVGLVVHALHLVLPRLELGIAADGERVQLTCPGDVAHKVERRTAAEIGALRRQAGALLADQGT